MEIVLLPPVPAALRALAAKQLSQPPATTRRTVLQHLIHLGRLHRTMQLIILERVKPHHVLTQAPNEHNSQWQLRLEEFDQSCKALGEAYRAYLAAAPAVAQVLAKWRVDHGIEPDQRFTYEKDDDALVLYLHPVLAQVEAEADARTQQALARWMEATANYFRLLQPPQLRAQAA